MKRVKKADSCGSHELYLRSCVFENTKVSVNIARKREDAVKIGRVHIGEPYALLAMIDSMYYFCTSEARVGTA